MYAIWWAITLSLMQTSNKYVIDGQRLQCFEVILDGENRNVWFTFLVQLDKEKIESLLFIELKTLTHTARYAFTL